MDLEKLYQDVYAQVFALSWDRNRADPISSLEESDRAAMATNTAHHAAAYAVKLWEPAKAQAAICAAQGLTPQEGK